MGSDVQLRSRPPGIRSPGVEGKAGKCRGGTGRVSEESHGEHQAVVNFRQIVPMSVIVNFG